MGRVWELQTSGKYGAQIEEGEYSSGGFFYQSRLFGTGIKCDTNFHKSLPAAKSFVKLEIGLKGGPRFKWVLQKNEGKK